MAYDGSLTFDTAIDTAGFNNGTSSISKQANGLKKVFSSLGKTMIAVFSVTQLVKFGKQAVELASDLQEVQNVVDTAFGDMKYKMEAFAESAIEVYGISKLTAKQTGSTFMAMAKGMNLAEESASNIALQLTALSADMASFYNKNQDVTSTALKSVFTGETETLKQFGIVMTEANLEAFRLAEGINKSYKNMSQAEKVALRYNYVMQQTKLAQGDFARTQDSWANQTRILSERWKEFLGILGNGLVKILTPLVQVLNTALQYLISFANTLGQLLGAEAEQQEVVAESIGEAVKNQNELTKATKETAKANGKTLASFDEIQKLTSSSGEEKIAGISGDLGFDVATPYKLEFETQSIDIAFDKIKLKFDELKEYISQFKAPFENWFNTDVSNLGGTFKKSFSTIFQGAGESAKLVFTDLFTNTVPQVMTTLGTYILPFYTQLTGQIVETITTGFSVLNNLFQNVWSTGLNPAIDSFIKIFGDGWETVYDSWKKWGTPIFENVRTAVKNIGETWQKAWDTVLKPVWDNFMNTVDWLWTNHLQPLLANFFDFVGELVNGALEIYNKVIVPIAQWLIDVLGPVVKDVMNKIINIVGTIVATIADVISGIITYLKGLINYIVGIFTGDWERAWEGIKTMFEGIWEGIKGIVKGAINLIIDFINGMITSMETGLNMIVRKINSLSFQVPDWVPGIGGEIWGFNIPTVTFNKIPKLATGTVVPANYGEFTAILGDNKREAEVVSPLSTMKQALVEALMEYGGQNITIKFEESSIGDLVRMLKPYIDKENRRIGSSTRVMGGAY